MFYIKIKNFKAYQQSDWIKLAPITLIYGVNSSGKSAVIQSCRIISSLLRAITRPTSTFNSSRYSGASKNRASEPKKSPFTIPLSGPDESGQIFDFGDYQQVVFGQDTKKSMGFSVRYSPNKELDKSLSKSSFNIPVQNFEHKLEATVGGVDADPISAKIERLKFSFKSAELGRHLWYSMIDEESPHRLDEILMHLDEEDAAKKIKELIPEGIDEIVPPLIELELKTVNTEEIDLPRHRGREETQLFEISESSIKSLESNLEPFIDRYFPDKKNWFKSDNRFFLSFSRGYGIYCEDKSSTKRVEKNSDLTWDEFPEILELEDHVEKVKKDQRKMTLRSVVAAQNLFWEDDQDEPPANIDHGFMTVQLIKELCLRSMRLYNLKFGSTNHIPGFRGEPARYEGALDNRTSPLSAALAYLAENPDILNLVLQDLKKLGIKLDATPQSVRFAGAQLDSFDFKPSGHNEIILTLADVGFGISQIIPILTAIRQRSGKPSHALIEEPEAHLHPSLQGNLMEHFAVNSRSKDRKAFEYLENEDPPSDLLEMHDFIIETHSENLVTRIQKLISQGKIINRHVSVVFCHQENGIARTKEIKISSTGKLMDPWPNDFIEPLFDEQ